MVSPVLNNESGGDKGRKISGTRADRYAESIVRVLKDELMGAEGDDPDDNTKEVWWLEPERITLKALTDILTSKGFLSAFKTPLTPAAVDRACKRGGFDWRALRITFLENRINLAKAQNLFEGSKFYDQDGNVQRHENKTERYIEMRNRRRLERMEKLRLIIIKRKSKSEL